MFREKVYMQQTARLRRWGRSAARHSSVGARREGINHRNPRAPSRRQTGAWSNGLMFNGRTLGRRERGASALPRRMIRPHLSETSPCLTAPAGETGGTATTAGVGDMLLMGTDA